DADHVRFPGWSGAHGDAAVGSGYGRQPDRRDHYRHRCARGWDHLGLPERRLVPRRRERGLGWPKSVWRLDLRAPKADPRPARWVDRDDQAGPGRDWGLGWSESCESTSRQWWSWPAWRADGWFSSREWF